MKKTCSLCIEDCEVIHEFLIRQAFIKGSGKYFVAAQTRLKISDV